MAARRLIEGLKSPWSVGFSTFGVGYAIYHIIDMTQSGKSYELSEDLAGKTYIVTGATSGIGQVTAEELAKRNARVIMACRNREKCVQVRRDIVLATRNKQVYCRGLDLEDFDSVRQFVQKLSKGKFELDRIDGVIHNAAMMSDKRVVNKDGIEKSLATNHLGSFLLTGLLLDKLLAQDHRVRIVFVNTNIVNKKAALNFEDLNLEEGKYDGYSAYKRSKLAQAMFAKDLAEKLKDTNISVFVTDPGRSKTGLNAQLNHQAFFLSRWMMSGLGFLFGVRRAEKAVRPVLYAIADSELEGKTGIFFDREHEPVEWEAIADQEKRKKIWATSELWTNLPQHLNELKHDLQAASLGPAPKAGESIESTGRSWRHLWLW